MSTHVTEVELDKTRHFLWNVRTELDVISLPVRIHTLSSLFFACCVHGNGQGSKDKEKETEDMRESPNTLQLHTSK